MATARDTRSDARVKPGRRPNPALERSLRAIKAVVFDFDGVFTDNRVLVMEDGREAVSCSRADGLGLSRLRSIGIEMAIISTETNAVVSMRANKLKLQCFQAVEDKGACLRAFAAKRGLAPREVAFVGNDINDADCLRFAGLPVIVQDAEEEVIPLARLRLTHKGGLGAVRELCDMLWRAQGDGEIAGRRSGAGRRIASRKGRGGP